MKQKGNDKTVISTTIFIFDFYSLSCFSLLQCRDDYHIRYFKCNSIRLQPQDYLTFLCDN